MLLPLCKCLHCFLQLAPANLWQANTHTSFTESLTDGDNFLWKRDEGCFPTTSQNRAGLVSLGHTTRGENPGGGKHPVWECSWGWTAQTLLAGFWSPGTPACFLPYGTAGLGPPFAVAVWADSRVSEQRDRFMFKRRKSQILSLAQLTEFSALLFLHSQWQTSITTNL